MRAVVVAALLNGCGALFLNAGDVLVNSSRYDESYHQLDVLSTASHYDESDHLPDVAGIAPQHDESDHQSEVAGIASLHDESGHQPDVDGSTSQDDASDNQLDVPFINLSLIDDSDTHPNIDHELKMEALVEGSTCLGGWNAINPSFAKMPGTSKIAVAFRGLCLHREKEHATWYSKMVMGTIPVSDIRAGIRTTFHWTSLSIAPDLRRPSATRHECHLSEFDRAKGPEDPRLVNTRSGLFALVTGYEVVEQAVGGSPECGEHGMLLYAARVQSVSPPLFGPPVQLTFEGMGRVEKNWAMFVPPALKGTDVLAVYAISPHTIAKVNLRKGSVNFIAYSHSEALDSLAKQLNTDPGNFHGGGGVAYTPDDHGGYFLSVLHTAVRRKDGSKEYWNYPYKFSAKPPYEILRIGKKLPLTLNRNPAYGEYVAFVTTVMVDYGDVFIGYGSGDSSSRTFRMPQAAFDAKFFPRTSLLEVVDVSEAMDAADLDTFSGVMASNATSQCASLGCHSSLSPSICRTCHNLV